MSDKPDLECDLCEDGTGGPMYLHSRCHYTAPLQASLADGVLTLRCYVPECGKVVAVFKAEMVLDPEAKMRLS